MPDLRKSERFPKVHNDVGSSAFHARQRVSCQAKRLCGIQTKAELGVGVWVAGVARIQLRRDVLSWLRALALKLQFDFSFCFSFCFCCFCCFWFCFCCCFGCCCFFVAFTVVAVAASCCTLFIQSPQLTPTRVPLGQLINNSDCAPVYNAEPAVVVAATAIPASWAAWTLTVPQSMRSRHLPRPSASLSGCCFNCIFTCANLIDFIKSWINSNVKIVLITHEGDGERDRGRECEI